MQTLLAQYATPLLLAGVALSLLALRVAIRRFNQSRRAPYYILREEAARSAGRWTMATLVLVGLTVALALFAAQVPLAPAAEPTPTPTEVIPTLGPAATRTARPAPTDTPSPTPTAPPTLTPTASVAPDVPAILLTPIPDAVAPQPLAQFEFLRLASRIDANRNPIDPGLQFPAGTSRVYVFFRASGVNNGAPWGIFCYRDGAVIDLFVGLWEDGPTSQTSLAFCALDGSPGQYVLRAYLGTRLAFEVPYALAGDSPTATPSAEAAGQSPTATP